MASIAKNNYVGRYYAPDLVSKLQSLRHVKQKWNEDEMKVLNSIIDDYEKATEYINKELKSAKQSVIYWEDKLIEFNTKIKIRL